MFDKSYPFHFIHTKNAQGEPFQKVHLYRFRAKGKLVYIVRLEEFEHHFFSIKFHIKQHTDSEKRYEMLTAGQEASRVINTSLAVMGEVLKRFPNASFGFVGAPLTEEKEKNTPTKRFRIYKRIMENFFSPDHFVHYQLPDKNAYILINRRNTNPLLVADYITTLLQDTYYF